MTILDSDSQAFPLPEVGFAGEDDAWDCRTRALLGDAAAGKLASSKVMVLGLGGVGSHCVDALARAGVGHFVLVDGDAVEESNLNRQAIAFRHTLGMRKVDACKRMVGDINPRAELRLVDQRVLAEDVGPLMQGAGEVDYIIDAIDCTQTKIALACYAQEQGIPLISCMGTAGKLDASRFEFADIYDTQMCPLCRAMRSRLRKAGVAGLEVLYSREEARKNLAGMPLGTVSYVPSIAGRLIAGRVIMRLAGAGL